MARPIVKAPPVSNDGLELFVVVAASPNMIAEAALPNAPAEPEREFVPAINVPALIVVVPVYVFTPDNVHVPIPFFVNVPEPVPIILAILLEFVCVPSNERPKVDPVMVPAFENAIVPLFVNKVLALPSVNKPL